jgi:hypothetical protein
MTRISRIIIALLVVCAAASVEAVTRSPLSTVVPAPQQKAGPAASDGSVVVVFRAMNRFSAIPNAPNADARLDHTANLVAVLRVN